MKINFQRKHVEKFSLRFENYRLLKINNEKNSGRENSDFVKSQFGCNFKSAENWKRSEKKLLDIQKKWIWNDFWPPTRPPPPQTLAYLRFRVPKKSLL